MICSTPTQALQRFGADCGIMYVFSIHEGIMTTLKEHRKELTSAQYEVVNVLSCLHSETDVKALKTLLVRFLNERLQSELDGLYDSHKISDATFSDLKDKHLRTPY